MTRFPRLLAMAVLAGTLLCFPARLFSQDVEKPADSPAAAKDGDTTPTLTLSDVEAALAAIEADSSMEDGVKSGLRQQYQQAIDALKRAAGFAEKAAEYSAALATGSEKAAESRDELKKLPPPAADAAKVTVPSGTVELQQQIDSRRATLSGLSEHLAKVASEFARVKGRPVEISTRLPEVQRAQSDIRAQLASPDLAEDTTSPRRIAERTLRQAQLASLASELEMLTKEQLSQSVREDLLKAQQELLARQVENATAIVNVLDQVLEQRLSNDAQRIDAVVQQVIQDLPQNDEAARKLAAEVQGLAKELQQVVENSKQATPTLEDIKAQLSSLTKEFEALQVELKSGFGGAVMAQVLFDFERRVNRAPEHVNFPELPTLDQTRLAWLLVKDKLRKQNEVEAQFADRTSGAIAKLVATRREVLDKLRTRYENLTRALAELEGDKSQYLDKANAIEEFIAAQLIWMRSCPPVSVTTFTDFPTGIRWVLKRENWVALGRALRWAVTSMPLRTIGVVLGAVVLLLMRPRMGAALEQTGVRTRRISTDRYAHTAEALIWTLLLAIPWPLLIVFAGWALSETPEANNWLLHLARRLQVAGIVILGTSILLAVCRDGGLGPAHFGWREETLAPCRRAIYRFAVVYAPAFVFAVGYSTEGEAADYFAGPGRIIFMLVHVWTAIVMWQLLFAPAGMLGILIRRHPSALITHWRYLWSPLVLAAPLILVFLAGWGYLIAAAEFSLGLVVSAALMAGGEILYCLARRWFMIRARRLALAEALERRRARQEAAASEKQEDETREVVTVEVEDENELDLESIGEQTRTLLRLLFSLGVAIALVVFWSQTIPLITVLGAISIPLTAGLTLLRLTQAVLILVVTIMAVQNLPGLLALAVLRATAIEPGTRYAIATLCQYAVIAIGLTLLFGVLRVDWAKFGWIAAALSVGIGFGLQEVVANFVCGLILLFERPLRVGDVVTLEGTTGTVTKIRMRSTTITNWDRQEFVVPNKTLITSTLLNWTLSAPLNRVAIPVGVAYGSDTDKARQILLDVAADHPHVLDDPAPMASFEQFADSSLNLWLRAYLPNLDHRLGTITELHSEINKRFAAAGIEIAFPQRDVHLRDGDKLFSRAPARRRRKKRSAPRSG